MANRRNEKALVNESSCGDFAMTFTEIGTIMHLRRGTVWTIYQRALRKLRRSNPGILVMLREAAQELDAHRQPTSSQQSEVGDASL